MRWATGTGLLCAGLLHGRWPQAHRADSVLHWRVSLVVEGSYHIAAWMLNDLKGDTLSAKLELFHDSKNERDLAALVNCYTWHSQMGSAVYIPPGFVCAMWWENGKEDDDQEAVGLRWGYIKNDKDHIDIVAKSLELVMAASQELKEGYMSWKQAVVNHLTPFAVGGPSGSSSG